MCGSGLPVLARLSVPSTVKGGMLLCCFVMLSETVMFMSQTVVCVGFLIALVITLGINTPVPFGDWNPRGICPYIFFWSAYQLSGVLFLWAVVVTITPNQSLSYLPQALPPPKTLCVRQPRHSGNLWRKWFEKLCSLGIYEGDCDVTEWTEVIYCCDAI